MKNIEENKNIIEIKTSEYKVVKMRSDSILHTKDIDSDICIFFYAPEFGMSCLARQINKEQLINILNELYIDKAKEAIRISIIGGDDSESSKNYAVELIKNIMEIDANRNLINVVTFDVNDKVHANTIGFNGYSGMLYNNFSADDFITDKEFLKIY